MGRLPDYWAGRKITFRIPYAMPGELILTSGQVGQQYPDATYTHNVDKPFEIHRIKPVIQALDNLGNPIPLGIDQVELLSFVRARITDLGKQEVITKAPTMLSTLVKGSAETTWEWAEPYTIVRAESFQIVLDALSFANLAEENVDSLRVAITLQGFLLVVAAPSESR